ncbi:Gfo/Idh/MocA family protein [Robertkochia solimangrovi]|uniref:Gfo/Idh/MocA family protein n=1 Tax=Robertkochia solimangrovi TaxID=2213046 RepID=UPI001181255D|nr:Gfo/Idh/MocA family oxidoreductase [Robertkochia solimangrovi]TRZ42019.1 gfo/Idh/MocA family oxidoreductase [Robertkochia solimangrovi]
MSNRREFLVQSAAIAAFSTLSFPTFGMLRPKKKLGVALVGLGYYSRDLLAPALQKTLHCELKGIVTGSPEKIPVWQEKYGITDGNVYNYENMHTIADNDEIDVVYVVLPNSLHMKYAIMAAEAGKHVWCEKPMAINAEECRKIIDACNRNKVKLSIGYRMQHEPNTKLIMKWSETKPYGSITALDAVAGFRYGGGYSDYWRLQKDMGGGALYDMGVYCINAIRYTTGLEPVAVSAAHETTRPDVFRNVDEITTFKLRFKNGLIATGKTSFAENINKLDVTCESGNFFLAPMQSYTGVQGETSDGKELHAWPGNQQAQQMDDDAMAIMNNSTVMVSGEEGMRDIVVVNAIFDSADNGGEWMDIV